MPNGRRALTSEYTPKRLQAILVHRPRFETACRPAPVESRRPLLMITDWWGLAIRCSSSRRMPLALAGGARRAGCRNRSSGSNRGQPRQNSGGAAPCRFAISSRRKRDGRHADVWIPFFRTCEYYTSS